MQNDIAPDHRKDEWGGEAQLNQKDKLTEREYVVQAMLKAQGWKAAWPRPSNSWAGRCAWNAQ